MELTLVRTCVKSVFPEAAKDFFDVLPVRVHVVGEDEDVVEVDDDTVVEEVLENVVHETLESGRSVGKSEGHN